MTRTLLAIVAALIPVALELLESYQKKDRHYDEKQLLRNAVASGNSNAVSHRIDELREKLARRRAGK